MSPTGDEELDLIEMLLILWTRKTFIVLFTLLITISTAGVCFMLPNVYVVDAALSPVQVSWEGTDEDTSGSSIISPQLIRDYVLRGGVDAQISEQLQIPPEKIPKFTIDIKDNTHLVTIAIKGTNPQQAVSVLNVLLNSMSQYIREGQEEEVSRFAVQRKYLEEEVRQYENRVSMLIKQMTTSQQKVFVLEKFLKKSISDNKSDEIITSYFGVLQSWQTYLLSLQSEVDDLTVEKHLKEQDLEKLRKKMAQYSQDYIKKKPTVSLKSRKTLIVTLSFFLSFSVAVVLAFLADFFERLLARYRTLKVQEI